MKFEKIHNKGQARLFKNRNLEILTKSHPLVIWGIYLPIITWFTYYAATILNYAAWRVVVTFIGGIFFWTFFEYIMHRYIFHWASESPRAQKFIYVMHGNHHHYPRDRERLFMPPLPSLILASIIFGLMYLLMWNNAFMFFPGFMLGYLLYGSMHYAIHAWNPPFKWLKPLWRNHHLHHYKDEAHGFGVSTTLWDRVFGTMFEFEKEEENMKQGTSNIQ